MAMARVKQLVSLFIAVSVVLPAVIYAQGAGELDRIDEITYDEENNYFGEENFQTEKRLRVVDEQPRSREYRAPEPAEYRAPAQAEYQHPAETGRAQQQTYEMQDATRTFGTAAPSGEEYYQTGEASWYGREFHGRVTASGEKFDMYDLTAAHRTLPFGTILEVKNLQNGKTTRVRVNDRGPYRGQRVIDMSFDAARALDMVQTGHARVGIKVLRMGDNSIVRENLTPSPVRPASAVEPVVDDHRYQEEPASRDMNGSASVYPYVLQAGAFYSQKNATSHARRIEGIVQKPVVVIHDGYMFKVWVEGLRDSNEAASLKDRLNRYEIKSFLVESK